MITLDDIIVEVRSAALGMLGQINLEDITDLKIIKRYNNTGAWSMSLPAELRMAQNLAYPGRGLVVTGPNNKVLMSGPMNNYELDQDADDPIGMYQFTGSDDNCRLAENPALPQPSNADVSTQTADYDVRTGNGETIMRAYVDANIGPSAPAANRITGLTLQTNLNRGGTYTARARFDPLGQLMAEIGLATGLGFDLVQVGSGLQFQVYVPQDKSGTVRMDFDNQMLDSSKYGLAAPTLTEEYVAGQGEGSDRRILSATNTAAQTAATLWGRKIRRFRDRRDTADDSELIKQGVDDLAAEGDTRFSLNAVPADLDTMVYGKDWYLGDVVGIVVGTQELKATVTESIIAINKDGIQIGATIGDPTGFDWESLLIQKVQKVLARVDFIERNFESGPASESRSGYIALGTAQQVAAGVANDVAVTPATLDPVVTSLQTDIQTVETSLSGDITALVPAGSIIMHGGAAAPPGWFLCDGSTASRTTYAALFAAIGTTYGTGNGTTTFTLPNLKGRVVVGIDAAQTEFNTRAKTGGEKTHVLLDAEMPSHTHTITVASGGSHSHAGTTAAGGSHSHAGTTASGGAHTHSVTIGRQRDGVDDSNYTSDTQAGDAGTVDSITLTTSSSGAHTHTFTTDTEAAHTHTFTTDTEAAHTHTATAAAAGSDAAHNNLQPYMALNYIIKA